MRGTLDKTSTKILTLLQGSEEPLETKEIETLLAQDRLKDITRIKVLYRLNLLRGDGTIKGKPVGSGKGTWIWWGKTKA